MKKIILLCLVTLISLSVFAQSPRLMSMGDVEGYLADSEDIFTYPATIHKYGNTAYAYLGGWSGDQNNYNFGVNLAINEFMLGAYFNKPVFEYATDPEIVLPGVVLDKQMELFFGFKENMAIYFALAMDGLTEPGIDADNEDTEVAMNFAFGYGYSTDKMDIGVHFAMPVFASEVYVADGESIEESEAGFGFGIDGRITFAKVGKVDFVGKGALGFFASAYDDGVDDTKDIENTMFGLDLGVAGIYNHDENNKVIFGCTPFAINMDNNDDGTTTNTELELFAPVFNIGLESKVLSWLVVRAGATQEYWSTTENEEIEVADADNIENTTTTWDSAFNYNMGMGVKFKNFCLDFTFEEDFLHNGPNFITGQNTGDIAGEMMLKYKF